MAHPNVLNNAHQLPSKQILNGSTTTQSPVRSPFNGSAIFLPVLMLFSATFGHSIIRKALPAIPFLLPTGVLLFVYFSLGTARIAQICKGILKTTCAMFFLFAAIQNSLSFQLHQSFLPLPHTVFQDMVNESTTFHPLAHIDCPQFLVISFADHVPICSTPSAVMNQKYSKHISQAKTALDLVEQFAEQHYDVHCVELTPIFSIPNFITIGVTPDTWSFSKPNTPTNNPFGLLRALHTISQRSIIALPTFIIDLYHKVITTYNLQHHFPYLTQTPATSAKSTDALISLAHNLTVFQKFMLVGLIFCAIGDVLLIFGNLGFLCGLGSFLIGHLNFAFGCLFIIFHVRIKQLPSFPIQSIGVVLLILWFGFKFYAWATKPGKCTGPLKVALLCYMVVIGIMTVTALLLGCAIPPAHINTSLHHSSPILYHTTDNMEYKPLLHDSLVHVMSVFMRAPMYISAQVRYLSGLTDHNPTEIANNELFSHFTISSESFGAFFLTLGSILFVISDTCVAREKFVKSSPINQAIGLPVYFFSVLLLSNTLLYM